MAETNSIKIAETPTRRPKRIKPLSSTDYRAFFINVRFLTERAIEISEPKNCFQGRLELLKTAARCVLEVAEKFDEIVKEKERSQEV